MPTNLVRRTIFPQKARRNLNFNRPAALLLALKDPDGVTLYL